MKYLFSVVDVHVLVYFITVLYRQYVVSTDSFFIICIICIL